MNLTLLFNLQEIARPRKDLRNLRSRSCRVKVLKGRQFRASSVPHDRVNSVVTVTSVSVCQSAVKYEQKSRHRYLVYANRCGRNIDEQDVCIVVSKYTWTILYSFSSSEKTYWFIFTRFTGFISYSSDRPIDWLIYKSITLRSTVSIFFVSPLILILFVALIAPSYLRYRLRSRLLFFFLSFSQSSIYN